MKLGGDKIPSNTYLYTHDIYPTMTLVEHVYQKVHILAKKVKKRLHTIDYQLGYDNWETQLW